MYHQIKHGGHTIILMPPVLLRQWYKWLSSIGGIQSVLMYKGTPQQRRQLDLNAQFVLMSMDIFKRDFQRIYDFFEERNCTLIVDEAVCVKNPSTQNHRCVKAFHTLNPKLVQQPRRKAVKTETGVNKTPSSVETLKAMLNARYPKNQGGTP